jgi:hypothetical protein
MYRIQLDATHPKWTNEFHISNAVYVIRLEFYIPQAHLMRSSRAETCEFINKNHLFVWRQHVCFHYKQTVSEKVNWKTGLFRTTPPPPPPDHWTFSSRVMCRILSIRWWWWPQQWPKLCLWTRGKRSDVVSTCVECPHWNLTTWWKQTLEFCAVELWDHLCCIINILPRMNIFFSTPFTRILN